MIPEVVYTPSMLGFPTSTKIRGNGLTRYRHYFEKVKATQPYAVDDSQLQPLLANPDACRGLGGVSWNAD